MTVAMPDSINVDELPPGYPAYLGYVDGAVIPATCAKLAARFPAARRVCLTTTGGTLDADGCDIENGDLTIRGGADWVHRKLSAEAVAGHAGSRPITYASVGVMGAVVDALWRGYGIKRSEVRLLAAHYTGTAHICGPASCGELAVDADGTQWTDHFVWTPDGNPDDARIVDMSQLRDDFFGPAGPTWTERLVRDLPVVRQGDTGEAVRTVQSLCVARHTPTTVDGVFGPLTRSAIMSAQKAGGIPADGVVGPLTWPVLLGITP